MASLNKAQIIGFLGKDPETKEIKDIFITNFSIATNENWVDKDGKKQEKTEWHNIVAFGKLAEAAGKYLVKGSQAYVEGKLTTDKWEKDGHTFYQTKVVATNIQFLDKK